MMKLNCTLRMKSPNQQSLEHWPEHIYAIVGALFNRIDHFMVSRKSLEITFTLFCFVCFDGHWE